LTNTHRQVPTKLVLRLVAQPDIKKPTIHRVELGKMVNMLIGGMEFERMDLWPFYYGWCFATGEENENFSKYHEKANNILHRALSHASCYEIRTQYGIDWSQNFNEIQKIVDQVAYQSK
jgi:hypothetical protein